MLRFKRKLPSANTVRRNAKATISMPTTGAYRSIDLIIKKAGVAATEAEIKKMIKNIKFLVNAKCYFEASAKHIIDCLNRYMGLPFAAGILHIPLTDSSLKTIEAQDMLRWGMNNVQTFEMEIELADVAENDDVTISGEAWIDNVSENLGLIREIHEFTYAAAVAGNFEVSDLPKYNGALDVMHIDCANNIQGMEYKVDNVTYLEGDLSAYNELLKRTGGRIPQSGYVHHDLCCLNRLADCLPLSDKHDIRYYLDMKAAQTMQFIMVTLSQPLGAAVAAKA